MNLANPPPPKQLVTSISKMAVEEENTSRTYSGIKVLVTGGAGYFGHRLGASLKQSGADVTLFDCRRPMGACDGMTFVQVNMGLINKVDMVCLSPVGYGV